LSALEVERDAGAKIEDAIGEESSQFHLRVREGFRKSPGPTQNGSLSSMPLGH
jgi:hypothetical protein